MKWIPVLQVTTLGGAAMILVGYFNGGFSQSATGIPRILCFAGIALACGSAVVMGVLKSRKSGP